MGYYKLRMMLLKRNITIREVADETGINLEALYKATSRQTVNYNLLSQQDKQLIYDKYFKGRKNWEEVFELYDYSRYEFDTVYKDQAAAKRIRFR